jgi:hypothetical protein
VAILAQEREDYAELDRHWRRPPLPAIKAALLVSFKMIDLAIRSGDKVDK